MEYKQICDTIFRLYMYALSTKKIHYSTDSMHGHKLADEIYETIFDFSDELAEQVFSYYGKPNYNDLNIKQDIIEEDDLNKICQHAIDTVAPLRTEFSKNDKLSGIVSLIDDFNGKMQQKGFLGTFDKLSNIKIK